MISTTLQEYLDQRSIHYQTKPHDPTVDAMRTAEAAHIPGREFAKTVIVKADGRLLMAVLPSTEQVHLDELQHALGAKQIELASEDEIQSAIPDCEPGAMPPFGNLYNMEVFVNEHLRRDEQIWFNAGSHDEVMQLSWKDFDDLVHPQVLHF